ncbi:protocadherin alpha 2 [Homo sapiens]|uniref:Protocadherin alpha-2 n=1 Tax=Homo sapiens TaxID=9606 RepID=PCDA2_HUMAN|nr:protocadherin alpha-2 isoform 1 precursor [Homo sapiens]Q9Y5H9.1 RecName: Full=Protocadherin alpha-2; Short=PCDH-alpha-2; Flags: Precursor [Homo sapiens]AAD43704.1 protocadherin alpha 2 [Homo sapiens]KAI4023066.1 protocadherin alpha 2 [Homo sapiens]|eukprot:NP_061728.1 protocadherin alpha-2 isoform 1 precursor [Homo sapiens]
MASSIRRGRGAWTRLLSLLLLAAWEVGSGQLRYSVPEEAKHGTFVGRIAQDLGLELEELVPRLFRVASKRHGDLLEVNLQNGILFVNSRIDREELCGRSAECSIHVEVIVDRPLQVFHVEVEVKDINDNPPIFPMTVKTIRFPESRLLDSRFPLEGASDADIGVNALLSYKLSSSEFFFLDIQANDELSESLSLVLGKSLDREETAEVNLLLVATDGGKPELTGTVQILIKVLDVNDNEPTFAQSVYKVKLLENTANGTLVVKLNASDADEGPNSEIVYSLGSDVSSTIQTKFTIDPISGEIRTKGKLDYEEAKSYEIQVTATDKGTPSMSGHCKISLKLVDINDNTPEVSITSLSLPISENASLGTVIALITVSDRDSGTNGHVTCSLTPHVPFKLVSTFKNYYSLVLDSALDRESVSAYELVVTARDGGSPSLWATTSVSIEVADVNDNAPAFAQPEYTVFVKENNPPGCHIFTVSAWDADAQENALVSYSLVERRVGERALSSYVSVHAESGKVYALQPLDHEEVELLQFQVSARDAGVPPLGSNVTLQVFVLDENDNAPALLAPRAGTAAGAVSELVPWSVGAGHVVAKVRAVDADSGYNAWLSYELQLGTGSARIPFRVGLYTGEISTTRALDEADSPRHRLLVLVKDHGEPALTATATVLVSLVESGQAPKASSRAWVGAAGSEATLVDVNVYLIIAICAVSSLLVLTVLLYTALRCSVPPTEGARAPGKPTLVCSSAVGSWSYSQQRRQRVCSGEDPPKTDLMAFSPSLSQGPDSAEEKQLSESEYVGKPRQPNPDWRYSASLRAGMHSSVHLEEAGILRAGPGGPDQQWPTVSSATPEPEAGEVSPPVGAGVNSNSWTFKYGPGNPKQSGPGELPDKFIIPGSPAIISIRQEPTNSQIDKSDFITFGKKEETKKKKKKKKGNKTQEKKEKGNSTTDNSDQ